MVRKECTRNKVKKVMGEYKNKQLVSHGKTVESKKQAIAIALSIAKKTCAKFNH